MFQTRKILDLYHYSMLTRNRARERFQSYSEDTQSQLNHGGGEATGFLSSGSSVLMNEMLDLEDGDVLDTSNEVAIVTTFILDVSTSLEFDNLLNKLVKHSNSRICLSLIGIMFVTIIVISVDLCRFTSPKQRTTQWDKYSKYRTVTWGVNEVSPSVARARKAA